MTKTPDPAARLRFHLAYLAWGSLSGALVVAAFTLGFYSWVAIAVAVIVGGVLAWPAAVWLAGRIKAEDPAWNDRRDRPNPPRETV